MTQAIAAQHTTEAAAQAAAEAVRAAEQAAVRVVRAHDGPQFQAITALAAQVWGPTKPLPADLMRAVTLAGGTVLLAESETGAPAGFAFGFLGWTPAPHLHSHMAGVLPEWRSHGVGYALKLAQRADCLRHGVTEIRWTFDPLVRVNATFNLLRLGARPSRFLPNFYGRMGDAINGADVSDRLEVCWRLDRPVGSPARPGRGPALLAVDGDGMPQETGEQPAPDTVLPVPTDYPQLRAAADPRAARWRQLTGRLLNDMYHQGLGVVGLGPEGYLVGHGRHTQ